MAIFGIRIFKAIILVLSSYGLETFITGQKISLDLAMILTIFQCYVSAFIADLDIFPGPRFL